MNAPWLEFKHRKQYVHDLHGDRVLLTEVEYNHAHDCVNLVAAAKDYDAADDDAEWEAPHPIFQMAADIDRLNAVNRELRAALEAHQELTRPIQRTIDILAKTKG